MDEQLQKYFLGELNSAESLDLLEKVESDEALQKEFIEIRNANALLGLLSHENDETIGYKSHNRFVAKINRQRRRNQMLRMMGYAAAIAILFATAWWGAYQYYTYSLSTTMNTLYVPAGQRACITMQDGTKVWLNAQSTLIYPSYFFGKERKVSLTGEAFFDVAKDAEKPFIVSTKNVDMNVLGTQFNVHSYPKTDYVETSLLEGSVEVIKQGSSPESIVLKPNQQAIVNKGHIKVSEIDNFAYFLWRDGVYSFENESFKNIIDKLELYYDLEIVVNDASILDFVYTGKFRQRDGIDEILHIIQKIHKFKISKNEERSTITLSK